MTFEDALIFQLKSICSELWSPQAQGLAALISTGKSSSGLSWRLFHEYREWGLLHLLVLSGSQYYAFSHSWMQITQALQKLLFQMSSPTCSRLLLLPATFYYLNSLGNPPPLLRCALYGLALQFFQPLKIKTVFIVGTVFFLQIILIEEGHPSDSAFLSWLAFFTLQISTLLTKNQLLRGLFITSILHFCIGIFKNVPMTFSSWIIASLSNLICLPLFEKVIFPCVGYISALCVILCPLFAMGLSQRYFSDYLAPLLSIILDLAILPVLVANSAFRYTFSQ